MVFAGICAALTLLIALRLAAPLMRAGAQEAPTPDVAFYKAQLAEVDRDVARQTLDPAEAEHAKAEIARRLIAATSMPKGVSLEPVRNTWVILASGAFLLLSAAGLYWQIGAAGYPDLPLEIRIANSDEARENRPSQAQAVAAAPAIPQPDAPEEYLANIAQLRAIMTTRPDDIQGWSLLAHHEGRLRQFAAAATAQTRVIELKGSGATIEDKTVLIDYMVAAANGFVSPEAESIIRDILAQDDQHIPARAYLGSLYHQTDRPDIAFRMWRDIVENGPVGLFHTNLVRDQIEDAAFRAGTPYTLPVLPGPTAEDIANAASLSPQERSAMIAGMVASQANRLATQGGPVEEWARLITAYGVLGETVTAQEIYTEARDVFNASDTALTTLQEAAISAGITP